MFSAILLVAAIGANQQQEPLFPRLFPSPTGSNALEYYVRAADIARELRLELWNPYLKAARKFPSRLEYEERTAATTKRILDLIRAGNRFPAVPPEGKDSLMAYAGLKVIAKLALGYSRVQFVRGNPDEATEALLLVNDMSARLHGSGGMIQLLVSIAIDGIAFFGFHSTYTSISLNGANNILNRLAVHDTSQIVEHWNREIAMIDAAVSTLDEQYDAKVWEDARPKALFVASRLEDVFAADESQWMALSTSLTKNDERSVTKFVQRVDAVAAQYLVRVIVSTDTKRRLMRVHALIAKYRWETGALPKSLTDLPEEAHLDPAAGQPYVYQRFSEAA